MEIQPEKYTISLEKASKSLKMADHLTYMTFPLVRENRLLLKILDEIYTSVINSINAMLQYEYIYKRIHLYKDPKENFRTFKAISSRYNINKEQLDKVVEILTLNEKHKKSPFEFVKKDKIVILSDNLKTETLNLEKIKSYLTETKDFLRKVNQVITRS